MMSDSSPGEDSESELPDLKNQNEHHLFANRFSALQALHQSKVKASIATPARPQTSRPPPPTQSSHDGPAAAAAANNNKMLINEAGGGGGGCGGSSNTLVLQRSISRNSSISLEAASQCVGTVSSRTNSLSHKSPTPTPSRSLSPKEIDVEIQEREAEERKKRLQLYVFVARCIAYPFNSKKPEHDAKKSDTTLKRQLKITRQQLDAIINRFNSFLKGETQIIADEAFQNAVQNYYDIFLKSDSVAKMIQYGAFTKHDLTEVFNRNIEKRVRSLPEIEGLSKETVLASWKTKFECILKVQEHDSKRPRIQSINMELMFTKEQLYDTFQQILGVKKFEHQLLYNALMLDSPDEQAAAIRREIDGQKQKVAEIENNRHLLPEFETNEMEAIYIQELRREIAQLIGNLEGLPVSKGSMDTKYGFKKLKRSNRRVFKFKRGSTGAVESGGGSSGAGSDSAEVPTLMKTDISLNFALEVIVMELKGLKSLPPNHILYCTMEVDNGEKLQTDQAEACRAVWDTQGDFTISKPLPIVKIKLFTENTNLWALEDRELGKLILKPTALSPKTSEWHKMIVSKNFPDQDLHIKITCRMEKPLTMKHCGYLYAMGKNIWKKWKCRYYVLVQVSQYTFAMCSYKERKSKPSDMMQLDGYTVDYIEATSATLYLGTDLKGGRYFFNAVKQADSIVFASDEENECHLWVMAMYRATGQSHKPTPPITFQNKDSTVSKIQGDADKAKKHGMEDFISADPCQFDHKIQFQQLQNLTLEYRLNDPYCSLGWLSPGQTYVLEEYCCRYGVRQIFRHLTYLSDLLDRADKSHMIDPTLMNFSYAFCAEQVLGDSPKFVVTLEEKEKFMDIKNRLRSLIEKQLTNLRETFPFARPEGSLKATICLLVHVLMKDVTKQTTYPSITDSPVSMELRTVIKNCLGNAANKNYKMLNKNVVDMRSEENLRDDNTILSLNELSILARLCVDFQQQNQEYYSEAFAFASDLFVEHSELFWSLFSKDMEKTLFKQDNIDDMWECIPLFHFFNDYLKVDDNLKNGRFHQHLRQSFSPLMDNYIAEIELSIISMEQCFDKKKWDHTGNGWATCEYLFWKIEALQSFIKDLWHESDYQQRQHGTEERLRKSACAMIDICIGKTEIAFEQHINKTDTFLQSTNDYILPIEICVMINVMLDGKNQLNHLCLIDDNGKNLYNSRITSIDDKLEIMTPKILMKLITTLETILKKLNKYDEGNIIGSLLSFARVAGSGTDISERYGIFLDQTIQNIRTVASDEWIYDLFESWYTRQMNVINNWLSYRSNKLLQSYQYSCLVNIVKKIYSSFEQQGLAKEKLLTSQSYQKILQRFKTEEAACSLIMN